MGHKMSGISFVIVTAGNNDSSLEQIIDSIECQNMPEYECIIVGGRTTNVNRKNTIHIPFNEEITYKPWLTRKKNLGVHLAQYDIVVVMHDYYVFDSNWYEEFVKFGFDWDICVHQNLACKEQNYVRGNGWRAGPIPGYPELPFAMTIPWDIDCFIPYMAIQGAYWVAKRNVMLEEQLNENLLLGQDDDIEWSARVVPGWLGQKPNQNKYKIVCNPNCITRNNKTKEPYQGDPDFEAISKKLNPLWEWLRAGNRRSGVLHYDGQEQQVYLAK
jgi:hypothetical protein